VIYLLLYFFDLGIQEKEKQKHIQQHCHDCLKHGSSGNGPISPISRVGWLNTIKGAPADKQNLHRIEKKLTSICISIIYKILSFVSDS